MPLPGQRIPLSYARKLVSNYEQNKLEQTLPADETLAVWFSKETILDALGLPPDTTTTGITGIRFYFAAYEQEQGYPENSDYYDKMTLVMATTGEDTLTTGSDYAYLDKLHPDDVADDMQPEYPNPNTTYDNKSPVYNEGSRIPPPDEAIGLGMADWK